MGQVSLPYSLANGNLADASEVMANLNAIVNEINGNIESINIKDLNVTTAKLDDGAVTTVKIADANITTSKIADGNVTTSKIADSNVTTSKIADSAITNAKIANDAITNSKIADDAVQAENINGLTGTGNVSLDNIPEGSTNKYFSDKTTDDLPEGDTNKYFSDKTLDDLPDGSTYKRLKDANSNNHPTRMDNNTQFESSVSRYLTIWCGFGAGWEIISGDNGYIYDTYIEPPSGTQAAGGVGHILNLPHGCTITEIKVVWKNPSSKFIYFAIDRIAATINTDSYSQIITFGRANGIEVYTWTGSVGIDNLNYCYRIRVWESGSSGWIKRIRLKYTITKPLP